MPQTFTNHLYTESLGDTRDGLFLGLQALEHDAAEGSQHAAYANHEEIDEASLDWFYRSPEFDSWKTESGYAKLCLYGLPSSGKTSIMNHLLQTIAQRFDRSWNTISIFCSRSISNESCIVATLARQLLQGTYDMQATARAVLEKVGINDTQRTESSRVSTWWNLLEVLTLHSPERKSIILVDGIDALPIRLQKEFLLNLNDFATKMESENRHGRLLLATRRYPGVESLLTAWPTIEEGKERMGESRLIWQVRMTDGYQNA